MKFFSFLCGVIFGLWMFWVTVKVWNIPFQKSRPIDSTTTTSEWRERKWIPLDSCSPRVPNLFQFQNDPETTCIGAAGNSKENPNGSEQGLFRGLDSLVYAIEFSK
jgi:hypothetical protein